MVVALFFIQSHLAFKQKSNQFLTLKIWEGFKSWWRMMRDVTKMEVKLLVFFKGQLGIIQRIVWFWMSVMIQEWNNSWIANTVILYFPNQISKEPIGIQLFYVKSRRQNLEFLIQVFDFIYLEWIEVRRFWKKGELQSKS